MRVQEGKFVEKSESHSGIRDCTRWRRQEKVSVGDLVTLDRVAGEPGSTIELPVLLLVDGDKVTADAKSLASAKVVAEKVEDLRGPKIVIQKYKNKTGYKKRQGFRAELTTVKITAINA